MTAEQAAFGANITTIIANIATVLALIPLLIAVVVYIKGRLTKRTLKLADIRLGAREKFPAVPTEKFRPVRIVLYNQSSHNFYIKQCSITFPNSNIKFMVLVSQTKGTQTDYESNLSILVPANAPCIIEGMIFDDNTMFPQRIEFQLQTLCDKSFSFVVDTVSICETIQMKRR